MNANVATQGAARSHETATAILDAARSALLDFGVRRTTLSDIAARAGVSRMTVYKRFGDLEAIVRAVMRREFTAVIERVAAKSQQRSGRARLVELLLTAAHELPSNPLFLKVTFAEPELLAPYVFHRLGATQRSALELILEEVLAGQRDGSIRAGDARVIAAGALLTTQGFVFSGATVEGIGRKELIRELELALEGQLSSGRPTR